MNSLMMKKSKICFAITSITDNGVTRVVSILLDCIDYDKYDVYVLLTRRRKHLFELNNKSTIIEVANDITDGRLRNITELRSIILKEKFNTVVALGDYAAMYTLIACLGIKQRIIVSERNDPNKEPDKRLFRLLRNQLYKNAETIVCQTHDAAKYFESIVPYSVVIYNPVKDDLPVWEGPRKKNIVNFCRIDKQKNLSLLVEAFEIFRRTHKDYYLDIYGEGPEKEALVNVIQQKGLSGVIRLHDFCMDIHDRVKDAMMFVSSSDFEGMSNSMLESMAMGIPTICTDCPIGGAREIIQDGENGWLVPVGDVHQLAEKMNYVADNEHEAKKISLEARNIRIRLSKEEISQQWWKVIDV